MGTRHAALAATLLLAAAATGCSAVRTSGCGDSCNDGCSYAGMKYEACCEHCGDGFACGGCASGCCDDACAGNGDSCCGGDCGNDCGWFRSLCQRCGLGCAGCGEFYWCEWHNNPPPCCEPCNCHGDYVGPGDPGYFRSPAPVPELAP